MRSKPKRFALLLAVPSLACAVFAGQVYLQFAHDLSVWKGGGMGMFAGIGAPQHRFLKIYLTDPLGQKILTTRLNSVQLRREAALRAQPTERNFEALAQALASTRWVLRRETIAMSRVDSHGQPLAATPEQHLSPAPASSALPDGATLAGAHPGWLPKQVRIEFWEIRYDVASKRLSALHTRTHDAPYGRAAR